LAAAFVTELLASYLVLLGRLNVTNVTCFRVYSSSHHSHCPLPQTALTVTDAEASTSDLNFGSLTHDLAAPDAVVLVGTVAHQCYRIAEQARGVPLHPLFDFAVVDESSQLDVGKALFPLCLLTDDAEISFFGDHLQMPPVIATQPPRDAEWLVGSIQTYLIKRHRCSTQPLLVNYRAAQPFVAFGQRIGYPSRLTAHSPAIRLHRLEQTANQPTNWNQIVSWFPGLLEMTDPQKRLVAVTYQDGRAGQANDFEADLVCSLVQQLLLTVSKDLDDELDAAGNPRTPQHALHATETFWDEVVSKSVEIDERGGILHK
jgi:hypothetical protein